jgi:proteasome alpha subunit
MQEYLEENYTEGMDLDGGIGLALRTLASVGDDELEPEGVGVATVDAESERFVELTIEETAEYIDEHDLLADDAEEEE